MLSFVGTIVVALLAFAGTYISNQKSNSIWQYRVQQLEEKQDRHNNIIERTYELEKKTGEQERDMKTAFNQISEVKENITEVKNKVSKLSGEIQSIKETEIRIETRMENQKKENN